MEYLKSPLKSFNIYECTGGDLKFPRYGIPDKMLISGAGYLWNTSSCFWFRESTSGNHQTCFPKQKKQHSRPLKKCGFQAPNIHLTLLILMRMWKATNAKSTLSFLEHFKWETGFFSPGYPFLCLVTFSYKSTFLAREFTTASAGAIAQGLKASSLKKSETLVWANSSQQKDPAGSWTQSPFPPQPHLSSWGMPLWMAMAGKFCSTKSWARAMQRCTDFTKMTTWAKEEESQP